MADTWMPVIQMCRDSETVQVVLWVETKKFGRNKYGLTPNAFGLTGDTGRLKKRKVFIVTQKAADLV